ncbi:MAG: hypothetical protein OEZ04_10645, partial [Nitrospinota bacterium]|nr:hypothetical protein [Nitrospinota bacterium]
MQYFGSFFQVTIVSVYGYCLLAAATRRGKESLIPFFVVSIIIFSLYLAAITGVLYPVAITIKYGGFLGLALGAWLAWRGSMRQWAATCLPPPFLFFIGGCVLAGIAVAGTGITILDEFTHWGLIPKYLYYFAHLPTEDDTQIIYASYPPGLSLFHYFGVVGGSFDEGKLYQAGHVLIFASLAPIIFLGRKTSVALRLIAIFFAYLLILTLGQRFKSLLADPFLGLFLASIIMVYIHYCVSDPRALLALAIPIGCLVIIKDAGSLLAMVVVMFILLSEAAEYYFPRRASPRPRATSLIAALAVIVILPFAVGASWKHHTRSHNISVGLKPIGSNISGFLDKVMGGGDQAEKQIVSKFYKSFSTIKLNNIHSYEDEGMALTRWLAIVALMTLAAWYLSPRGSSRRRAIVLCALLLLASGVIYCLGVLMVYLEVYHPKHSLAMPAFARYMDIYILAYALFAFGALMGTQDSEKSPNPIIPAALLVMVSLIIIDSGQRISPLSPFDFPPTSAKADMADSAAFSIAAIPQDKSTLIECGDKGCGIHQVILQYELVPLKTNMKRWSAKGISKDPAKQAYLAEYDYIFLLGAHSGA